MDQSENRIIETLDRIEKLVTHLNIRLLPTTEILDYLLIKPKEISDEIPSFLRQITRRV